jgi:amidophosphoribosyltransferase
MLLASENPRLVNSSSDSETLLEVLANELYLRNRLFASDFPKALFSAIEGVMLKVKGSYSVLGIIMGKGFFAFRDPFGIKPIVFGKKVEPRGASYAFASESVALDALGYASVDNLRPGEALFIDMERTVSRKSILKEEHRPCVFEYIYFASPASVIDGISVSRVRQRLGEALGRAWKKEGKKADCVLVVPSSATHSALGMARELGIPFEMGILKNHYVGRSFIEATKARRDRAVRLKLDIDRSAVCGKRVIVVDDSIVRGTTSRYLVRMLREAGCEKVYFVSSAPPIKWPCVYGIDMSIKKELIAADNSHDDICRFLEADALLYQTWEDLRQAVRLPAYCDACFTGSYPTEVSPQILKNIELGRILARDLLKK